MGLHWTLHRIHPRMLGNRNTCTSYSVKVRFMLCSSNLNCPASKLILMKCYIVLLKIYTYPYLRCNPKIIAPISFFWWFCRTLWTVEFPSDAFLSCAASAQVSLQRESEERNIQMRRLSPLLSQLCPFQKTTGKLLLDAITAPLPRVPNSSPDPTQLALATPLVQLMPLSLKAPTPLSAICHTHSRQSEL